MNAYIAHFRTALKEDFRYYTSDSLLGGFAIIAHITVALLFWHATNLTEFFGIYTWPMLVWYLIFTQLLLGAPPDIIRVVNQDIKLGRIAVLLSKPYNYAISVIASQMAPSIVNTCTILVLATPVAIIAGGSALPAYTLILGIPIILLSFIINFTLSMCIALIAFWTEDANPYRWVYSKLIIVFGGVLFPLDLLPSGLQTVAKLLPTAFFIYYPARLLVDFSWNLFAITLLGQLLYVGLFTTMLVLLYAKAIKKVSINGG